MTEISGFSERVTHTREESAQYAKDIREARLASTMPMLQEVADRGDKGLIAWGERARVLNFLEGQGLVRHTIERNPSAATIPGVRDRVTFYVTDAGRKALEG
jgi:hypothetical protein